VKETSERRALASSLVLAILAVAMPILRADTPAEEPVGLVLSPGGGKLLRANTETSLAARAGDLLFSGDGIRTAGAPASFLFCPGKSLDTLSASGEVRLEAKTPKVKTGKISEAPARACTLPPTLRIAQASQQHYGVSMTRGVSEFPPVPKDKLPAAVVAEIEPLEAAAATDTSDASPHVALATVYERNKLPANALAEYRKVIGIWQDAEWVKGKIFDLEQSLASAASASAATAGQGGQTYALLVGISKYKNAQLNLQFADKDAIDFSKLVATPRFGGVAPQNVLLLTDEKATSGAVRNGFQQFLKGRANKDDTVVILLASHGTAEVPGTKDSYVLTYDSDPQDLKSTAITMAEIHKLFQEQLGKVGRVLMFVDVCKAGAIGTIQNTPVTSDVQGLGEVQGTLFGLLASGPKEFSFEGPQYGGGHGAFSYYVLKGLLGDADRNKDGSVTVRELIRYVQNSVADATMDKQNPKEFGVFENEAKLADLSKPGMEMARRRFRTLDDPRWDEPILLASASPEPQLPSRQAEEGIARFEDAIQNGRLLSEQPNNASDALAKLKPELSSDQYFRRTNELRVALDDEAQKILLRYLQGDQNPQTREEFAAGARYSEAGRKLTKESLFLEGRENFFEGRSLLFDKKFPDAASMLETAVRFDPSAAYGYNALGIAYLEQAQFDRAIPAFRDAAKRAVHWSYPLHNLALSYVETGNYRDAIKSYQQAMKLTPQYSYLPYNLGLVYQRINRRKEAEASYRQAIRLSPDLAQPYNALGTLKASEGKRADAEQYYKQSLAKDPKLLPARHNLAILLSGEKNRQPEAIDLWKENLQQSPDYLASRLSLAQFLSDRGDVPGAIEQYRQVTSSKPNYVAAHGALAGLLAKGGDADAAVGEYQTAAKLDPQNPEWQERIGDTEAARNHPAEAKTAYTAALNLTKDRAVRKRIENKEKAVH
jgi:tetratricopeptide (TPR) repeat protein